MEEGELRKYIDSAGLNRVLNDLDTRRAWHHCQVAQALLSTDGKRVAAKRVFIDSFIRDGQLDVDDLTFFFDEYIFSISDFRKKDGKTALSSYIMDYVRGLIHGFRIHATDFDFPTEPGAHPKVGDLSDMTVSFAMRGASVHVDQSRWIFRAYGKNCEQLTMLVSDFILPNMLPGRPG